MTRIITRILSSIYSIFPIPLYTTLDTSIYTRNFLDYSIILARLLDYPIKIK